MLFVYIWHRYRELMLAGYCSRLAKGRGAAYESLKWPQFSPAPVAYASLQQVEIRLLPRLKQPT